MPLLKRVEHGSAFQKRCVLYLIKQHMWVYCLIDGGKFMVDRFEHNSRKKGAVSGKDRSNAIEPSQKDVEQACIAVGLCFAFYVYADGLRGELIGPVVLVLNRINECGGNVDLDKRGPALLLVFTFSSTSTLRRCRVLMIPRSSVRTMLTSFIPSCGEGGCWT